MSGSIRVSRKHGVNPSVERCFYCGEATGVVLFGQLAGDREAPRDVVLDRVPCAACKAWMAQGVICISVRDGESGENPYRTGGWVVLTADAVQRIFHGEVVVHVLKSRVCFIPDEAWDAIGLPRGPITEEEVKP
jgi:hypothetical protein